MKHIDRYVINSRDQVVETYDEKGDVDITKVLQRINDRLGCRVAGKVEINKVPGTFVISSMGN
jgi:hypothetical protein